MKIPVEHQTFKGDDIYLDGHSWFDCEFINCKIIFERGEFDLIQCSFDGCKLVAKGNAISIIKLLRLFHPDIPISNNV